MRIENYLAAGALIACIAITPAAATWETWDAEFRRAVAIRKREGSGASLQYLDSLSGRLASHRKVTVEAEYRRFREMARDEDSLNRLQDADVHLERCAALAQSLERRDLAARVYATQFSVLLKLHRLDDARVALERSRVINIPELTPYLLLDEGILLEHRGHFEDAVKPISDALVLFQRAKQKSETAKARINLAWAYVSLGRYDKAAEQYQAGAAEANEDDKHLYLGNLGNVEFWQRDFKKAALLYRHAAERAKGTDRRYYVGWLVNEAEALLEAGDANGAISRNRIASLTIERENVSDLAPQAFLNDARILIRRGELDAALERLAHIVLRYKDPTSLVDTYSEIAQVHILKGEYRLAREAHRTGISLIARQQLEFWDAENQLSFAASGARLNRRFVSELMLRGRSEEALEAAEDSRASVLRRKLGLSRSEDDSSQIAAYREAARQSSSAYLVYWVAPERSYVWAITGSSISCFPLPGEAELSRLVNRFETAIQGRANANAFGAELFRVLVRPAQKYLEGLENVVVLPDGALHRINFETLRQGTPEARYWIEDVTVSVAPSLALSLARSRPESGGRRILIVGDAVEWDAKFPRLLNSQTELNALASRFPAANRKVLTKAFATPAAYEREQLGEYRFIHFATHASDNANAPLESAIVLSFGDGRGLLTARDILKHPVNAEVISLSACRSAGATAYTGEGLVGLAWAFLHSGAHSVVAAIWDVSDYSSPLLMSGLYDGLNQGRWASEALRGAKLNLLRQPGGKYTHPYYWGPFVLYQGAGALDDKRVLARR